MIVFYNQSEKDIPEYLDLERDLVLPIHFSDKITRVEKVVIVSSIEDADKVFAAYPVAHLLLKVNKETDLSPREAFRLFDHGITDLYVQSDAVSRLDAIRSGLEGPKYFPFLHPNDPPGHRPKWL